MPCYLFSYHAYGSWLPDRNRGYVRRGEGILPQDREMAERYRSISNKQLSSLAPTCNEP